MGGFFVVINYRWFCTKCRDCRWLYTELKWNKAGHKRKSDGGNFYKEAFANGFMPYNYNFPRNFSSKQEWKSLKTEK